VAVTLLVMISTIVFGTFFYTVNNAEQLEQWATLNHGASFILDAISRSVSAAYVPYAGAYFDEDADRSVFIGAGNPLSDEEADYLGAFTKNPRFGGDMPGGEIAYVTYKVSEASEIDDAPGWIEDENNPLVLMCIVEPLLAVPDTDDEEAFRFWMLNISSLNFNYFDGDGWLEEWDFETQGVLPGAVKIELGLGDSEGERHSYTTIARIRVNTLLDEPPEPAADVDDDGDLDGKTDEAGDDWGAGGGEKAKEESQPLFPGFGNEGF
jgi:hypothetical protein